MATLTLTVKAKDVPEVKARIEHLEKMISRAELLARHCGGECPWCRRLLGPGQMGHKSNCDALPFVGKVR